MVAHLASPQMEGRGPGTAGIDRARDWIAAEFKAAGLEPAFGDSYLQELTIPNGVRVADQALAILPPRGAEGCQAPFQTDEEVPDNGEKAPATARRSESRKGRSERGGLFCGARPATKAGIAGAGEAIARRRSRTSWRSSSPSPTMSRFGTADTAIASRSAWPRPWAWIITPRQKKASRRKKS